jgi:hypothetical protein
MHVSLNFIVVATHKQLSLDIYSGVVTTCDTDEQITKLVRAIRHIFFVAWWGYYSEDNSLNIVKIVNSSFSSVVILIAHLPL